MNDNLPPHVLRLPTNHEGRKEWLEQLEELREIGARAVAKPETLSMGEIREIAWGFLMAAGTLKDMAAPH